MFRLLVPSLGGLIVFAVWLFAVFDVIATDDVLVRNLPKPLWLLLVIIVPLVGSIAWLVLGRPLYASWQPGGQVSAEPRRRFVAPEDRADFAERPLPGPSAEDLRRWEDDLARREREIRGDEDDG